MTIVSEFFSLLFADGTYMFFFTTNYINALYNQLNEDLRIIQEWSQCNKWSVNLLKTHYMAFAPKIID